MMSGLPDIIGTPIFMNPGCTSDGITSDSSSNFSGIPINGLTGVLFLCLNNATIGESTNTTIQILYSSDSYGSNADNTTDVGYVTTDCLVAFSTALGLAAGTIRSIWVDLSAKNMTEGGGYLFLGISASESAASMKVVAIPQIGTGRLPVFTPTVTAND